MSWINDVRDELQHLRIAEKELKKFGILVGSILALLSGIGLFRGWNIFIAILLLTAGLVLAFFGASFPGSLRHIYKVWMAAAFAIGWLVSRIILLILFYVILTPIGFFARAVGKEFLEIDFKKKRESYWIQKGPTKNLNYEKLF